MTPAQIEWLGLAAGACTTLAFVPQVVRTWRTRQTRDLSGLMLGVFCLGVALWLVYGLQIGAWPVIAANTATLGLGSVLVWFKLRDRGGEERDR